MSYTIYLVNKKIDNEWQGASLSPTFNLSAIFYNAMGVEMGHLEGMTGINAIRHIRLGLSRLKMYPDYYARFNPKNGWGNYDGAVEALEQMQEMCEQDPEWTLNIY